MKESVKEEFIQKFGLDTGLNYGYGMEVSDLKRGMLFMLSPNFVYPQSTDKWTLDDAIEQCHNSGGWCVGNGVFAHYSDEFEILKISKKRKKGDRYAYLRVKNLRTDVDFNILVDDVELYEKSTVDLYMTTI